MAAFSNCYRWTNFSGHLFQRSFSLKTVNDVFKAAEYQKPVTVQGWVSSMRKMKDLVFADINDGSSNNNLQIVIPKHLKPSNLTTGSSLEAVGELNKNPNGQLELQAESITLIGSLDHADFPFSSKQKHNHDYCRQYLSLRPKLSHFKALLRVRHRALLSIHQWYDNNEFLGINTPILTSNDCEGAGEIFKVLPVSQSLISEMKKKGKTDDDAFFGCPSFLSVSGQLHLEAMTRSLKKVYSISPTFRAENSKSRLHLSEFYMVESEEAFVTSLDSILNSMEQLVKFTIEQVITHCKDELETLCKYDGRDTATHLKLLENIVKSKFHTMLFDDATKLINANKKFQDPKCESEGLNKEHELFLVDTLNQTPVFVIDWPSKMKPFYMKNTSYSADKVSAVDLLVPNVGELCGGSLREDDYERLRLRLQEAHLTESLQWYLDLRKFGNVPTGGFGMGFERFLQLVTGLTNIKDTIPFPRWPHSLKM